MSWNAQLTLFKTELEKRVTDGIADSSVPALISVINTGLTNPTYENLTTAALEISKYKIKESIASNGNNPEQLKILADIQEIQRQSITNISGNVTGLTQAEAIAAIDTSADIEVIKTRLQSLITELISLNTTSQSIEIKMDAATQSVEDSVSELQLLNSSSTGVNTKLTQIFNSVDGLEGFTDNIETAISITNTKLDAVVAAIDGVEGFIDGVESNQNTQSGYLLTLKDTTLLLKTAVDTLNVSSQEAAADAESIRLNTATLVSRLASLDTLLSNCEQYLESLSPTTISVNFLGSVSGANVINRPAKIYSIYCSNLSTATRYLQLFDRTSSPTPGLSPSLTYPIYGESGLVFDSNYFSKGTVEFTTGISWGFSSTPFTFTPADSLTVIANFKVV